MSAASQLTAGTCATSLDECKPIRTNVAGADGRTYRVDTYVRQVTLTSGRPVKRVTVVVRGADGKKLARLSSTFDLATGCCRGRVLTPSRLAAHVPMS